MPTQEWNLLNNVYWFHKQYKLKGNCTQTANTLTYCLMLYIISQKVKRMHTCLIYKKNYQQRMFTKIEMNNMYSMHIIKTHTPIHVHGFYTAMETQHYGCF